MAYASNWRACGSCLSVGLVEWAVGQADDQRVAPLATAEVEDRASLGVAAKCRELGDGRAAGRRGVA